MGFCFRARAEPLDLRPLIPVTPAPGEVAERLCEEVLKSQLLGPLRDGAEVEEVLCWLHFNDFDGGDVLTMPALVRRI
jgi:hypothetical protein